MKKLFLAFSLIATPAFAQTAPKPPTVAEVQQQWLIETGQLRVELGQTLAKLDAASKELEKAKANLKASDEAIDAKDE